MKILNLPTYSYIGKTLEGDVKTGSLQANDERQLAQNLKKEGVVLIKVVNHEEKVSRFKFSLPFNSVSLPEKIMITRNLEIMFSTGLSLIKSFDILAVQAKSKKVKIALTDVKEKINKGDNLSDALSSHPSIFSELFVNMVKVGEESGNLEEVLQVLSLQLQKEHELKSRIKNATIYPSIIMMVMIIVGIVVVAFVIPNLKLFFNTLNVEVPIYTKIIIFISDYFTVHWYLLFLVPLMFPPVIYLTLKNKKGKIAIDTFLLKLPVLSAIIKKNNSAFLIRSLSSLIASGVPLTRSLEISSKTIRNYHFQKAITDASEKIKKGEKLSNSLKSYQNIFPVGVIEMIEIGEETGKTSDILKKLANFYEQEAANAIERLTVMIEPILIIVLGVGVGLFAISIIQPMYSSLKTITE